MSGMAKSVVHLVFCLALLVAGGLAAADDGRGGSAAGRIPYKSDGVPLEQQGLKVGVITVLLLAATGGGLYLLRKRIPGRLPFVPTEDRRLRLTERLRISPRCTLYVVELDKRECLICICGDKVVRLMPDDEARLAPAEVRHG